MKKPFIIAEIGINHNGDLDIAKQLIDLAKFSGCDAVKFQKRTIEDVYAPEALDVPRKSPFGTTNREQKNGLEFGKTEYDEIDRYCKDKNIEWFASAWDIKSQEFLRQYDLKYNKVASAMLTIEPLLEEIASEGRHTFISTGMSTLEEIDRAVEIFKKHNCPFELMHCNSSYPTENSNSNLGGMQQLKDRYGCDVGYSGHEKGIQITLSAVTLGVSSVERHITLDKYMYGSDQFASIAPMELLKLCRLIDVVVSSMGDDEKTLREEEVKARESLSKPYWWYAPNA
tara:strand:- start:7497 stop:8351 length:855 start_codon:yes stop_codon:yes gene_type:complete